MNKIKAIRATTGLSQQKFGDWLGIPARTIENWEANKSRPAEYLVKLIAYYVDNHAKSPSK